MAQSHKDVFVKAKPAEKEFISSSAGNFYLTNRDLSGYHIGPNNHIIIAGIKTAITLSTINMTIDSNNNFFA